MVDFRIRSQSVFGLIKAAAGIAFDPTAEPHTRDMLRRYLREIPRGTFMALGELDPGGQSSVEELYDAINAE